MCLGGGGGGGNAAGEAAKREETRQTEQDDAVDRINALFGIGSGSSAAMPDKNEDRFYVMKKISPRGEEQRIFNQALYDEAVAKAKATADSNQSAAANKTKLESLYSGVGNDVSSYLTDDLNNQYENADRANRFGVARRGVRGGSSELDVQEGMQEDFDKGVVNIGNRSTEASNQMRLADSGTRLNLINRIMSGMSGDAAIVSAQQSLKNNSDSIRNQALSQSLDNVFRDTSYINNQESKRKGTRRADEYYGTYYPSTKSYNGSVKR